MERKKILIVDDEEDIREVFKKNLEVNDYNVITANDGSQGVKRASEERPDLILLDVMMPVMDGFKSLKELKKEEITSEIPVLMLTVRSDLGTLYECLKLGAKDYILKTYDSDRIIKYVKKYVKEGAKKFEIRITDDLRKEVICRKNYSCLSDDTRDCCRVKYCFEDTYYFIAPTNGSDCNYLVRHGKTAICICSVRKHLYAKYKI